MAVYDEAGVRGHRVRAGGCLHAAAVQSGKPVAHEALIDVDDLLPAYASIQSIRIGCARVLLRGQLGSVLRTPDGGKAVEEVRRAITGRPDVDGHPPVALIRLGVCECEPV